MHETPVFVVTVSAISDTAHSIRDSDNIVLGVFSTEEKACAYARECTIKNAEADDNKLSQNFIKLITYDRDVDFLRNFNNYFNYNEVSYKFLVKKFELDFKDFSEFEVTEDINP